MQFDEFMQKVQELTGLDTADSERAARATLSTLAECLYRTEQRELSAQLSKDLRALFSDGPEQRRRDVERLSLETFYNRVSARTDAGFQQAVTQARAVMAVLREAVGAGAWQRLHQQFPEEYDDLFAPTDLERQTIPGGARERGRD